MPEEPSAVVPHAVDLWEPREGNFPGPPGLRSLRNGRNIPES